MAFSLLLFGLVLWVTLICLLVVMGRVIVRYDWAKALRQVRFSMTALLAVVTAVCIALAGEQSTVATGSRLYVPWWVTLPMCLMFFAIVGAIVHDFRGHSSRDSSRQSALEAYRSRQQSGELEANVPCPADNPEDAEPPAKKRRKWWLRRLPNRFRSIGHRVSQETPVSSRYDRE